MKTRGRQPWLTNRSRALRSKHVSAERVLWRRLNNRQLGGFKFARQEPVGPYFADFVCREPKLVVEVDGGTHSESKDLSSDQQRTAQMQELGYHVIRVHNIDVCEHLDYVLDALLAELNSTP